jgi:hypothetical protein
MWQKLKTEFREKVWDNEQVLKARQKFTELDTQTQSYILIGSFGAFVLFLLVTFFTLWGGVISVKNQIAEIESQTIYAQKAAAKVEEFRAAARSQGVEPLLEELDLAAPLVAFLERVSQKSLINKANVEISESGPLAEMKLSRISLTQLVRVLFILENAGAGTKVEKMNIDAKEDRDGYLWASLSVKREGRK